MAKLSVDDAIEMLERIADEEVGLNADAFNALQMGIDALEDQYKKTLTVPRAFNDPQYDYYVLKKPFGPLPKGAVFYHDLDDHIYGSIAQGCLKLCWTPDGDTYGGICGGTVILHCNFAKDKELFKKNSFSSIGYMKPGKYRVTVYDDGKMQFHYDGNTYDD